MEYLNINTVDRCHACSHSNLYFNIDKFTEPEKQMFSIIIPNLINGPQIIHIGSVFTPVIFNHKFLDFAHTMTRETWQKL